MSTIDILHQPDPEQTTNHRPPYNGFSAFLLHECDPDTSWSAIVDEWHDWGKYQYLKQCHPDDPDQSSLEDYGGRQ